MQSSLLATMAFLLVVNFAQAQAGFGDALKEIMLVDGNNPTGENFRKWKNLDAVENLDLVAGEKVLERGAKTSEETPKLTLTDWKKQKGIKPKKGNFTRKERVPKREDADAKLWERLAKEKSKEKEGSEFKEEQIDANLWDKLVLEQEAKRNKSSIVETKDQEVSKEKSKEKEKEGSEGEFKEEQIDANLWDKLVLEQARAKRNKSSIVDEAIARARAAKETKDREVDRKLEEDVSLLTDTDWAAAINFLKMEQFSTRQGLTFTF